MQGSRVQAALASVAGIRHIRESRIKERTYRFVRQQVPGVMEFRKLSWSDDDFHYHVSEGGMLTGLWLRKQR